MYRLAIILFLTVILETGHTAPTFTIGEPNILKTGDSGNGNLIVAQEADLSETGTLQSLNFYVTSAVGNLILGIYDSSGSGGRPGALLAATDSFTPVSGWNKRNVISPVVLSPGTYWIAYLPSDDSLRFENTGSGSYYANSLTFGSMPSSFPLSGASSGGVHWSFYGTLSTQAPAPTPTPAPTLAPTPVAGPNPIPRGRSVSWKPGLTFRGGIQNRTSFLNVKAAPYNARGDGSSDDKAAIQAALDSCPAGSMVYLPAGTYLISDSLFIGNDNTGITGDGPSKTIILYRGTSGSTDMIRVLGSGGYSNPIVITSPCTQGLTQITLADTSGVNVGDILEISQVNPSYATDTGVDGTCGGWCGDVTGTGNGNNNRLMTQLDKVISIKGNTVTLERPLYLTFPQSNNPTAQAVSMISGIGIEHLQLQRNSPGTSGDYIVQMQFVKESWVKDVAAITEADSEADTYFYFQNTYACEVRESWAQGIPPLHTGSGQGYGVYLVSPNSDALIEDSVFVGCQIPNNIAGGGSGCVYGYNYCSGTINTDAPWYMSADLNLHGGEPYMNLFEGCIGNGFSFDNTWGGNAFNTVFRCWLTGHGGEFPSDGHSVNNDIPMDMQDNTFSPNIVGNVLGDPQKADQQDSEIASGPAATMFYQGNFSIKGGSATWVNGQPVRLPPSLYYSSQPAWWGPGAWPPIGPDLNPMTGTIPAQIRFNSGIL